MSPRPRMLFVSPQFLFPMDAGGKIRTANLLKNLKDGAFEIHLAMPATAQQIEQWHDDVNALADEVRTWPLALTTRLERAAGFFSSTPLSAKAEARKTARIAVRKSIDDVQPDFVVFDYAQSFAAAPATMTAPAILFAHNVETEILQRHEQSASGAMRAVWRREARKMARFESACVQRAAGVIAVSERDAKIFEGMAARYVGAIPTAVDSDYFAFKPPADDAPPVILFTGSLDWKANQEGLRWFLRAVWPKIEKERPDASFVVVGKNPPKALVDEAQASGANWRFTGFVDDIRDHSGGAVFVIPLLIGGGTRIKAFEAMAMGLPVVSTPLGVEGLPVADGRHLLVADGDQAFAAAVTRLLAAPALRAELANAARTLMTNGHSHVAAAREFEKHCLAAMGAPR